LHADRQALFAALLSLLDNAVQACDSGAQVVLMATVDGDAVAICVSDTGVGIAPEVQARLFEPFFTTRKSGTGLGLAIVRTVAEAHDGSVSACSTLGVGSEFVLRLPLVPLPASHSQTSRSVHGVVHDIAALAGC
jgi:two-component system sensor histidine kinase FlrB